MNPLEELFSSASVGPNHAADIVLSRPEPPGPDVLFLDGRPATAAFARAEMVAAGVPPGFVRAFLATAKSARLAAHFYDKDQPRGDNGRWGGGATAVADEPAPARAMSVDQLRKGAVDNMSLQSMTAPGLSVGQRIEYRNAASSVLNIMTEGALKRWAANVTKIEFHPHFKGVTEGVKSALRKLGDDQKVPDGVVGACVRSPDSPGKPPNRTKLSVIVDGGLPGEEWRGKNGIAGIYAHEFAHAIDGADRSVSSTPEWGRAWESEIRLSKNPPSDYAVTSEMEGFAEFGRLAFTHPQAAKTMYPKCAAVWKSHGLLD